MVRKKGPKGYLVFKLDLDKVYGRLEWSFIQDTLEFFRIPPNLIQLIINMISSTRFHITWNGSSISDIVPNRGGVSRRLSTLLEEAIWDKKNFNHWHLEGKLKFLIYFFLLTFFSFQKPRSKSVKLSILFFFFFILCMLRSNNKCLKIPHLVLTKHS